MQEEHLETATEPTTESSKTTGGNVKSMEPAEVMRERFPVEEARERRDGARSSKDSEEAVRDTTAEQGPSSRVAKREGEKAGARGSMQLRIWYLRECECEEQCSQRAIPVGCASDNI